MQTMLNILAITAPIYLLMALGYGAVSRGPFTKADMRVLGQLVIRFALPAMLFRTLAAQPLAEILNIRFLLGYCAGSLLMLGLGWTIGRRHKAAWRATLGMGMAFSNSGFVGAPVVLQWLGPRAGIALALVLVVENLFMLPLVMALADSDQPPASRLASSLRRTVLPLLRHPMIQAIAAGIAFAALGWSLPAPLQRAVDLLAQASAPLALVVIGGSLVGLQLAGQRRALALVAGCKLLLHPAAVAACLALALPGGGVLTIAGITLAAMPMLSIYPVLTQKHGHDGFAAAALLVATAASFFTLSALIALLGSAVPP